MHYPIVKATWPRKGPSPMDHAALQVAHHKSVVCRYPQHAMVFGAVIFFGCFISMMVSTVNGAGTPILVSSSSGSWLT